MLNLPSDVLNLLEKNKISPGHAKILVGLENASFIANKIIENKLSVRQSENFVKLLKKSKKKEISKDPNIQSLEETISSKIGLNVVIRNNKRNKGTITISFNGSDQLNRLIDIIKNNY